VSEASAEAPAKTAKSDAGESAFARLVGVFVSPVRTFAAIAARPTWLLPVAIMCGITLPVSELILSKANWRDVVSQQIAKSGRSISDAQLDQAIEQARKMAWIWDVVAVLAVLIACFFVAAVLWGACRAFGWDVRFKQSLGITAHAFFPGVIGSILLAVVLWNRPTVDLEKARDAIPTNLGFFAQNVDKVTYGLLSSIDLFSFWSMALLVLGLSSAAKTSRGRMAALVVSLWALYVLGKTGVTALFA
jgi:hypothetical protein